jgi:hypothetical protein
MRYKKLIRKPHFETVEQFQKFMVKCTILLYGVMLVVFFILQ